MNRLTSMNKTCETVKTIRKTWGINPVTRIVSSKKHYKRSKFKKFEY